MFQRSRAQSLSEYLLVIALVIAAATVMHTYMKRGLQAAIKVAADELAPQAKSEEVVDLVKGGFLLSENSSSNQDRDSLVREYDTPAQYRHALGQDDANVTVSSASQQGHLLGEFEAP